MVSKIEIIAKQARRSRNAQIVEMLAERLSGTAGWVEPTPNKVTVRPIETVEDVQGVVGPAPEPEGSRPRGKPQSRVAPEAGGATPCTHPKNRRENLGYSVKCGVCGAVLR